MEPNYKAHTAGGTGAFLTGRRAIAAIVAAVAFAATTLVHSMSAAAEDFSCVNPVSGAEPKVINTTLAGVPALVRVPKSITHRPVILWHGLGPPSEPAALMTALPLDEVHAVKVYLGLPLTGARAPKDGVDSLAERQKRDYATLIFEPIVLGAAGELPAVVEALRQRHCLPKDGDVDLFGFSAGGTAVLAALTEQKVRISSAITVNAPTGLNAAVGALERATHQSYTWSPEARRLAEQTNFAGHAALIARGHPALLMLQGAEDSVSSVQDAEALVWALERSYGEAGGSSGGAGGNSGGADGNSGGATGRENGSGGKRGDVDGAQWLKVVVLPGVAHQWAQGAGVDEVRANVTEWLNRRG